MPTLARTVLLPLPDVLKLTYPPSAPVTGAAFGEAACVLLAVDVVPAARICPLREFAEPGRPLLASAICPAVLACLSACAFWAALRWLDSERLLAPAADPLLHVP